MWRSWLIIGDVVFYHNTKLLYKLDFWFGPIRKNTKHSKICPWSHKNCKNSALFGLRWALRPNLRLKLRLVEWIWSKKSHKTKKAIFDLYRGHGPISLATEAGHFSDLKIDLYSSVWDWIKIRNIKKVREYGTELHPTTSATILTADLV